MPKEVTKEVKDLYSTYLKKVIEESNKQNPQITIITSHNDNTFMEHIPALLNTLKRAGIEPEIYYNDELYVTRHNNVVVNSLNIIYYCILRWLIE